ncbi:MAG: LysE family translocator, partial [Pseudomonadota bacterium]
ILPQLLILGVTYLVVDGLILVLWGWAATRALGRIKRLNLLWINRISGVLMVAAAALLGMKEVKT